MLEGGGALAGGGRNVEHLAELAGPLDVAAGVRHRPRRHCGGPLLELLRPAGDVEAAAELVRRDAAPHLRFPSLPRERKRLRLRLRLRGV